MTDQAFVDVLADLLKRAEVAHLAYQEEHGPTDWPQFYATHLTRALGDSYREEDVLTALLSAASVMPVPRMIDACEPGGVNWMTR